MLRVRQAHDVSRKLEHGVLESTTGTQERNVVLACPSNRANSSRFARIGGCGNAPNAVISVERTERGSVLPIERNSCSIQSFWNRAVSHHIGVIIADQGDSNL